LDLIILGSLRLLPEGAPLIDGIINNETASPTNKKPFDLIAKGLFC
jgi:hypothetical protein